MRISDWIQTCALPIYPAHQPVHAFRGNPPRRRFRRQAACDLAPEEHFGSVESEIGSGIDDLLADRRGGVPGCTAGEYARSVLEDAVEDTAIEGDHFVRSEEHTSALQALMRISYSVFGLKKKT